MAKTVVTMDLVASADVIQFLGDPESILWTCSMNALNPVTLFNEICLVSWNDGQVLRIVNDATWASKFQVFKVGTVSTSGIVYA